jgi:DHA1 family multidrug resistance protein-like MFS transporter
MASWLSKRPRLGPLEPWQRSQYIIALTVALAQVGSDLTQPFMALYVYELGVTDPTENARWAGLVAAAGPIGSSFMGPLWGAMSDRFGRKAMVMRALIAVALLQMFQAFVPDVHWLFIGRLLHGMFAGFGTMAMALAILITPRERMGQSIGLVQAAHFLPTAVGPLIGGLLSDRYGLRTNFLITGVLLLIPMSIIYFGVHERDYTEQNDRPRAKPTPGRAAWRHHLMIPGFAAALGIMFAVRFTDKSLVPIMPLFLAELDTPRDYLATVTGLVVSAGAIAAACSAAVYGRRSRPDNTRRLLMIALAGGGLCSLLLAMANNWQQVVVLRLALGLLAGGTLSLGYALGARLAPPEQAGLTLAILASCGQIGSATAPLLAGVLGGAGLHIVFLANGVAYAAALALAKFGARDARPTGDEAETTPGQAGRALDRH